MPSSYTPREHLLQIYRGWWLIALLGLIGGLSGRLVYAAREPIYASSIEFAVTIDTAQTGPLSEREYDRLQHAFGRVLNARDILDQTLSEAALEGIEFDIPTFRSIVVQEWRGSVWEYTVRHTDPETARTLAEIWGETAVTALETALAHAIEARNFRGYMDALITCGDPALTPGSNTCVLPPYEDIEQELAALTVHWEDAVAKSRGLIPAVAFEQTRTAELAKAPATSGQATLVFSGAVLGILIGIWVINFKRDTSIPPSS